MSQTPKCLVPQLRTVNSRLGGRCCRGALTAEQNKRRGFGLCGDATLGRSRVKICGLNKFSNYSEKNAGAWFSNTPATQVETDARRTDAARGVSSRPIQLRPALRAWRCNGRVHGARAQDVAGRRGRVLGQLRQGHRHGHECAARQCQRHPHLTDGRLDRRADAARVARGRSSRARRGHRAGHGRRCRRCARTRRGRGAGLLVGDDQARAGLRPALQYAPCS